MRSKREIEAIMDIFDEVHANCVGAAAVREQLGSGWEVKDISIEPLYLNLFGWRHKIMLGTRDFDDMWQEYEGLFDNEFERFLGWSKPDSIADLLKFFQSLLQKETQLNNHMYFVVMKENKTIGVLYFYDYKSKYRKANLAIGFKPQFRGKSLGKIIIESVIKNYMKEDILIRLGLEIETTNNSSIKLVNTKLHQFKYEGVLRNNYGVEIDCKVYSCIIGI